MAFTPRIGGGSPYVNHDGNPLRSHKAAALPTPRPVKEAEGVRARDVVAVIHHTPAGDVVERNQIGLDAIQRANKPHPHGGGTYAFAKR